MNSVSVNTCLVKIHAMMKYSHVHQSSTTVMKTSHVLSPFRNSLVLKIVYPSHSNCL